MLFIQIIIFLFFALAAPICVGAGAVSFLDRQKRNIGLMWMAGELLLLAAFQVMSVPMILAGRLFSGLVRVYAVFSVLAAAGGMAVFVYKKKKTPVLKEVQPKPGKTEKALWIAVGVLLLVQLFLTAFLAFGDGDDAYYMAVSTTSDVFDSMYRFSPYTGSSTKMDIRHSLSPFPVYIAFLSRVSGIHAAVIFHVALPLLLIPLAYVIYGMIGRRLLKGKRRQLPAFMLFVELLVLWGNYSLYTAETFLITRTSQGKAVLGNIMIPALFLLLYMMGERLAESKMPEACLWVLLAALVTCACLCSVLGAFLTVILLGAFCLCAVFSYKKWKLLLPAAASLLPAVVFAGMYMLLT